MTPLLQEHDYIGLSEASSSTMEAAAQKLSSSAEDGCRLLGSLRGTELRLGLPGSESPERNDKEKTVLTLGPAKSFASSGAKRVFSDAIDESGKWVFPGGSGSEVELGKGVALFSPKGENGGRAHGGAASAGKDAGVQAKVASQEKNGQVSAGGSDRGIAPAAKAQVVGWPPIRNYRKNTMAANPSKNNTNAEDKQGSGCLYVKVSMDGAPYLRKVDLKMYGNYKELSSALEKMFSCFTIGQCGSHGSVSRDGCTESRLTDVHGSEYVLTYEDKDGDWMLVGDVPWNMFTGTCKRMRIMKGSEAIGLGSRAMEKCNNQK